MYMKKIKMVKILRKWHCSHAISAFFLPWCSKNPHLPKTQKNLLQPILNMVTFKLMLPWVCVLFENTFCQQLTLYKVLVGHFAIVICVKFGDLGLDFVVDLDPHVLEPLQYLFLCCSTVLVVIELEENVP